MRKVKHGEWKTPAVAGSSVVMSTLSLSCSISNYKDFLLLRTEEIKRFKWHTRTDVCQRLCCDVMRFYVERPVCLCFVHALTQLVCANESTGRCAYSTYRLVKKTASVRVPVCMSAFVCAHCPRVNKVDKNNLLQSWHQLLTVHVWVGILLWQKTHGICQKTQVMAVCTMLGLMGFCYNLVKCIF